MAAELPPTNLEPMNYPRPTNLESSDDPPTNLQSGWPAAATITVLKRRTVDPLQVQDMPLQSLETA